jgi:hypothetical protein
MLHMRDDGWRMEFSFLRYENGEFSAGREDSRDIADIDSTLAMLTRRQFAEISSDEFEYLQANAEALLQQELREVDRDGYHLTEWADVRSRLGPVFANDPAKCLASSMQRFCWYEGTMLRHDDLVLTHNPSGPPQTSSRNLIFDGDLTINGNLDAGNNTTHIPQLVYVRGTLSARNLILTGWAEIVVTGMSSSMIWSMPMMASLAVVWSWAEISRPGTC